ncbi:MFS transporter [Reticulibacter mediterranei]|uniref:MFS transporter n=1 Tax=Reticulibacter mediterranei TaxID=2778369 RepID=A0A8J3MYQ4_9CHLR|nr:MFS transporter [Reticulibacter mediterranei]GHO91087.1 MFS transporter [Reticulibacter mediterranei]
MPFALFILALGAFAVGTDEYLVAGLLPNVAADMGVPVGVAGQLVTLFGITYAVGSPVLALTTAHVDRKRLLLSAIVIFALANLAAVFVPTARWLFVTRFVAALAASIYTPTAMATATQLLDPKRQGQAIAAIMAGITGAIVLGLPLGSWVGNLFGWRTAFAMVAAIGVIVTLLIAFVLPRITPSDHVITWRERVNFLSQRNVLLALAISFVALVGANSVLTYIMPLLLRLTTFTAVALSLVLFASGVASVAGNLLGGLLSDRWGTRRLLVRVFTFMMLNALCFSLLMLATKSVLLDIVVVVAFVVWGLVGWLGAPALNSYLVSLAPQSATVALSLNMTALYLGIAGGGIIGGLVLTIGSIAYLGVVVGVIEALALGLVLVSVSKVASVNQQASDRGSAVLLQGNED